MANNTEITIRVTAEGVKIVEGQVDKLASSTNKATKASQQHTQATKQQTQAQNQLNTSHQHYDRGMKGVAGATANGTKAFSKMRSELGGSSGLVAAYATIAANVFAATAAFGALQRAAQLQTLIDNLSEIGYRSGTDVRALGDRLKEATGNALSLDQALRTASFGLSAGFNTTQLEGLAEIGRKAASALGRDVGDAVDRLTRGVAKLEPEILDELGIVVRLDEATREYARSVGKTTAQLTAYEKQQAFANAVFEQGMEKYGELDTAVDGFTQLAASLRDLGQTVFGTLAESLGKIAEFLANNTVLLTAFIATMTGGIVRSAFPVFTQLAQRQATLAENSVIAADAQQKLADRDVEAGNRRIQVMDSLNTKGGQNLKRMLADTKATDTYAKSVTQLKRIITGRKVNFKSLEPEYAKETKELERQLVLMQRLAAQRAAQAKAMPVTDLNTGRQSTATPPIPKQFQTYQQQASRIGARMARSQTEIFANLQTNPSFKGYLNAFNQSFKKMNTHIGLLNRAKRTNLEMTGSAGMLGRAMVTTSNAFKKAGVVGSFAINSLKIAFSGLMAAIPIIGQIIFVLQILWTVAKKAAQMLGLTSEESKAMGEAQDKVMDSLKNLNKVRQESIDKEKEAIALGRSSLELTRLRQQAIISEAGALQETITALDEYRAKRAEAMRVSPTAVAAGQAMEDVIGGPNLEEAVVAWDNLNIQLSEARTNLANLGKASVGAAAGGEEALKTYRASVDAQQNIVNELEAAQAKLFNIDDAEAFLRVVGRGGEGEVVTFINALQSGTRVSRELKEALGGVETPAQVIDLFESLKRGEGVENLSAGLQELYNSTAAANEEGFKGQAIWDFLYEALIRSTRGTLDQSTALQTLKSAFEGTEQEFGNWANGLRNATTTGGKLLEVLDPLLAAGRNSEITAQDFEAIFDAEAPSALKYAIEQLRKETGNAALSTKELTEKFAQHLENIEKANKLLKEDEKVYNTRKSGLESLLKLDSGRLDILESVMEVEKQITQNKIDQIQNELDSFNYAELGQEQERRINELLREQEGLRAQLSQDEVDAARIIVQELENRLKLQEAINKEAQKTFDLQKLTLENEQKLANARMGLGYAQTEQQIADAKIASARFAVVQAEAQLSLLELQLALEREKYRLQVEQFNLAQRASLGGISQQELELMGLSVSVDFSDQYKELENAQRRAAELAVDIAEEGLRGVINEAIYGQMPKVEGFFTDLANASSNLMGSLGLMGLGNLTRRGPLQNLRTEIEITALATGGLEEEVINVYEATEKLDFGKIFEVGAIAANQLAASVASISAELSKVIQAQSGFLGGVSGAITAFTGPDMETPEQARQYDKLTGRRTELNNILRPNNSDTTEQQRSDASAELATVQEGIDKLDQRGKLGKVANGIMAIGAAFSAIGQMAMASAEQQIAAIDQAIAAEQKRDGKSKESIAKIRSMEAKKDSIARKAFEKNKKMQMAATIANTSAAIMGILARETGTMGVGAMILAGIIAAMGAAQLAIIAKQSYQSPSGGVSDSGAPTAIKAGGERKSTVDLARSKSSAGELAYLRGEQGIGSAESFKRAFMGAKYRAEGGATAGYIVGEQGPELFVPSVPGKIVPNNEITQAPPTNVTFNINAIDASGVEDMLRSQRGNIIGMIREAANSYGTPFLEDISVSVLTPEAGGSRRA